MAIILNSPQSKALEVPQNMTGHGGGLNPEVDSALRKEHSETQILEKPTLRGFGSLFKSDDIYPDESYFLGEVRKEIVDALLEKTKKLRSQAESYQSQPLIERYNRAAAILNFLDDVCTGQIPTNAEGIDYLTIENSNKGRGVSILTIKPGVKHKNSSVNPTLGKLPIGDDNAFHDIGSVDIVVRTGEDQVPEYEDSTMRLNFLFRDPKGNSINTIRLDLHQIGQGVDVLHLDATLGSVEAEISHHTIDTISNTGDLHKKFRIVQEVFTKNILRVYERNIPTKEQVKTIVTEVEKPEPLRDAESNYQFAIFNLSSVPNELKASIFRNLNNKELTTDVTAEEAIINVLLGRKQVPMDKNGLVRNRYVLGYINSCIKTINTDDPTEWKLVSGQGTPKGEYQFSSPLFAELVNTMDLDDKDKIRLQRLDQIAKGSAKMAEYSFIPLEIQSLDQTFLAEFVYLLKNPDYLGKEGKKYFSENPLENQNELIMWLTNSSERKITDDLGKKISEIMNMVMQIDPDEFEDLASKLDQSQGKIFILLNQLQLQYMAMHGNDENFNEMKGLITKLCFAKAING